jgi:hypothetical protein
MPITPGEFPQSGPVDRSAAGLSYQRYQIGANARGAALGQGRRVAPEASQLFSSPPISGGQFGGGHAKSMASFSGDAEPESE